MSQKDESKNFEKEKIVNDIIYFFFSVISLAIVFSSIIIRFSDISTLFQYSIGTAILMALYFIFLATYTNDPNEYLKNTFPTYGRFFSYQYWTKLDHQYFEILVIGSFILFLVIFTLSYLNNSVKNIYDYKLGIFDFNSFVYVFCFLFSIVLNIIFFLYALKVYQREKIYRVSVLEHLLSTKIITEDEFNDYSIQLQKDQKLLHSDNFIKMIFIKSLNKRFMIAIGPFANKQFSDMFYIFMNTSPDYEIASEKTYNLLFQLITSESFNSGIFLKNFYNLREELFSTDKIDVNSWTMAEILDIYLKNLSNDSTLSKGIQNGHSI